MKTQIIEKLCNKLNEGVRTEADVVYVLSRIRKILEMSSEHKKYNKLIFYCDWALHAEMSYEKSVKRIESEIKEFLANNFENGLIEFEHLRNELKLFLNDYGLPIKIIQDKETFLNFRQILIGIYSDTPIKIKGDINKIITFKDSRLSIKNSLYSVSFSIENLQT